jgi:hypothetical protein
MSVPNLWERAVFPVPTSPTIRDSLSHLFRGGQCETEKFLEESHFGFSVRESAWNIVYVKLRLVLKHASVGCQPSKPRRGYA